MKPEAESTFVAATEVRRALVANGDIRAEVEFQNDINAILGGIDDGSSLVQVGGWTRRPTEISLSNAAATARRTALQAATPRPRLASGVTVINRDIYEAVASLGIPLPRVA